MNFQDTLGHSRGHQPEVASPQATVAAKSFPAIQQPAEVVKRSEIAKAI